LGDWSCFLRCHCQIKFVIKKAKTFVYLITIMYSAADYFEMIIIFGECERKAGRQQESSKNVFRAEMTIIFSFVTHFFNFLLQYVVIIIGMT
jgi:hypothetical protein